MLCKATDWFLYDNGPRQEKVKPKAELGIVKSIFEIPGNCRVAIVLISLYHFPYVRKKGYWSMIVAPSS